MPEGSITEALEGEKVKYRNRMFNPIVTLWAFLSQVLDTEKSLLLGGKSNHCEGERRLEKRFRRRIQEDTLKLEKDCQRNTSVRSLPKSETFH